MNGTCQTCQGFCAIHSDCRINPPTVVTLMTPQGPQFVGVFPPTSKDGWCMYHMKEESKIAV